MSREISKDGAGVQLCGTFFTRWQATDVPTWGHMTLVSRPAASLTFTRGGT